ncbi:uncharacterized protein LOC132268733 isoform X2 [Cornus florida]|uniref:uncharacterized protein LOC132268733 isoform X2 n=1 Tax=Cornus florida TaxID=4283 RepID=UPI0028A13452|nr:uncharacterized protein LOC132268733 isoform X2 [Cornus florida]
MVDANSGSPRRTDSVQTLLSTIPHCSAGTTLLDPMLGGFHALWILLSKPFISLCYSLSFSLCYHSLSAVPCALVFTHTFILCCLFISSLCSSVLEENIELHLKKRCPLLKHVQALSLLPFYQKGINGGDRDDQEQPPQTLSPKHHVLPSPNNFNITSETKRNAVYSMTAPQISKLISKIHSVHASISIDIRDSYKIPEACHIWIHRQVDRKLPFQEKHVLQQASILGNLEEFGVLKTSGGDVVRDQIDCHVPSGNYANVPAVVEFGAGRGYLTQMLVDCYGINKVILVERKSYKLKADRSLRQKESLILERLRIDIEDLNLNAVQSLQGIPYLAIGKHLCGPATEYSFAADMTLRCCIAGHCNESKVSQCSSGCYLRGMAIATCCHHLCQWKHYINKIYLSNLGITKEDFHAITWFTSWAVDADHSSDLSGEVDCRSSVEIMGEEECGRAPCGAEEVLMNMRAVKRAVLGFMCKDIIDMGRLMWMKERGLETELVKYVPSNISPENHLLIARWDNNL